MGRKRYKVVLTASATEMSDHNGSIFLGFGTCSPPVLPRRILRHAFYPPVKQDGHVVRYAPYGLRKIEAALLEEGLDENEVVAVHPEHLDEFVGEETRAVGVSTMDPLGYGPVSVTFSTIFGRPPLTAIEFDRMMRRNRCFKRRPDVKVVVGGPGSWQLVVDEASRYKIDTILIGEGERAVRELCHRVVDGEDLPRVVYGEEPGESEVPVIRRASIDGLVEISRGCGRNCRFCTPTMWRRRDFPIEKILREVEVNLKAGRRPLLHSEDVLMYGSRSPRFIPDHDKVFDLFGRVLSHPGVEKVGVSHVSLAPVVADERLIGDLSELLHIGGEEIRYFGVQTGVETGSVRLMRRYMAAKPLPYRPEDWPEVVVQAFGIMSDHDWVPAATLVTGLPGETPDDVNDTIELVEDLGEYRSLIVPLFFVPMRTPTSGGIRSVEELLSEERVELFYSCLMHGVKWIPSLLEYWTKGAPWLPRQIIRFIAWYACRASKKIDLEELVRVYSRKAEVRPE